jgi:hypothetical protein
MILKTNKLTLREINHVKSTGKHIKGIGGKESWVGKTTEGNPVEIRHMGSYHKVRALKWSEFEMIGRVSC